MWRVIPLLVQWLALSYLSQQQIGQIGTSNGPVPYSISKKTHWALIEELRTISEDEIEKILPQLVNILVERDGTISDEFGIYQQLERVVVDKCAKCFPFGVRVCNLLSDAAHTIAAERTKPWGGTYENTASEKEERIRYLQTVVEAATANGYNLPGRCSNLRSSYYSDFRFMLESFSRLGDALKAFPMQHRNHHLRLAVRDMNGLVYNRMLSRGQGSQKDQGQFVGSDFYSGEVLVGR